MAVDQWDALLGMRSWRYSMLVEDGIVRKMFIEPDKGGDPFEVSDAETMLRYLRPARNTIGPVLMLARSGCPYCARAESALREREIAYDVVHVGDELTMQGVKAASGAARVPQVFVDGRLVGGLEQLAQYLSTH